MFQFYRDLRKGELGEKIIQSFLTKKYGFILTSTCKSKEWDFKMMTPRGVKSFELKTDIYEIGGKITGNILIEISHAGKPSGIMATESDYFIYYLPVHNIALCIESAKLKNIIRTTNYFTFCSDVGDGGRVGGVIANRNDVEHLFKKLEIKIKNKKVVDLFV